MDGLHHEWTGFTVNGCSSPEWTQLTVTHVGAAVVALACRAFALAAALVPVAALATTCTIGAGNLSFGSYTGVQTSSSSTLTVTCTIGGTLIDTIPFTATLSTGAGTYAQRILTNLSVPADTLPYNLYLNTVPGVLNTSVWGDGTSGTIVASGSMQLVIIVRPTRSVSFTIAGAIAPVSALPSAGLYTDVISAMATYN